MITPRAHHLLAAIGLLSALPILYFVIGSILKYELGLLPSVPIYPISPVILLGGGLIAVALNLYAVLRLGIQRSEGALTVSTVMKLRPWNLLVLAASASVLVILVGYVILENLVPH